MSETDVIYASKKDVHIIILAYHYFNHDKSRLCVAFVVRAMNHTLNLVPRNEEKCGRRNWARLK
jgi:hypothetical protein